MNQFIAELGRLPKNDLEVLRIRYNLPKQSMENVIKAISSVMTRSYSGNMPTRKEVIDSIRNRDLSVLINYLESGGSPSVINYYNFEDDDFEDYDDDNEGVASNYLMDFFANDMFTAGDDAYYNGLYRIVEILIEKDEKIASNNRIMGKMGEFLADDENMRPVVLRVLKLLVNHGVNINSDGDGDIYTSFKKTLSYESDDIEYIKNKLSEIKPILLDLGYNPEKLVFPSKSDVENQIKRGVFSIPLYYLENGGDLDTITNALDSKNPIVGLLKKLSGYNISNISNISNFESFFSILKIVLSAKKDYVNKKINGKTPLHYAAIHLVSNDVNDVNDVNENIVRIMKLLVENGAKISKKDSNGKTPFKLANDKTKSTALKNKIRSIFINLGVKVPLNPKEKIAIEEIKAFRAGKNKGKFLLPQSAESTNWQEICRTKTLDFTNEQRETLLGTTGNILSKREICAFLTENLEKHEDKATRDKYVRKNCPKDITEDGKIGVDPVSLAELDEYDPNDLLRIDGHCFSRETLADLVKYAPDSKSIRNPSTQVMFTDEDLKKIKQFLAKDNPHRMITRFEPVVKQVDPSIELRNRIDARLLTAENYIDMNRMFKMSPNDVAKMAKYVRDKSGGIYKFDLGDIAEKPTGLHALDLFTLQLVNQLHDSIGGWVFVEDWFKELADNEIAADGVPLQ